MKAKAFTGVAALQAVAGTMMVAYGDVVSVTVQVLMRDAESRARLAIVLGEALGADVETVGRSRFLEHGGILVELLSEEE